MVLIEPGKLELREFEVEPPRKDQILLKVRVTSVCASDPKNFLGKTPFAVFPLIMGHELVGSVAEIGEEAATIYGFTPGDRITIEPSVPCGRCEWCRTRHHYHKCRPLLTYGVTLPTDRPPFLLGGYAEYMCLLPGTLAYRIADGVPDKAASLSSVIGNGIRWVKTLGEMTFGQSLAISGVGSQGLATLIAARECGVGPIILLGLSHDERRFELAREFGADFTVDVEKNDPLEAVPEILGGPPDVVVETSDVPSAIQTALALVKMNGRVISIGLSGGQETAIRFDEMVAKGVTILSDHAQAGNVQDAMQIINSRKYALEKIINVTYSLEDLPRALQETAHPPEGFIKGGVVFEG